MGKRPPPRSNLQVAAPNTNLRMATVVDGEGEEEVTEDQTQAEKEEGPEGAKMEIEPSTTTPKQR